MKKHNFNAGPSILPPYTIEKTAEAVTNLNGIGMSILEISHRSKEFEAIMNEAQSLFKELMNIPAGYEVLYLGGGACTQFYMLPYNMLETKAAYLNTGSWASAAIKEAKIFGETIVVASSEDKNFSYIPKNYTVPADADYFHITTNNTIFGSELLVDPTVSVPMVADMSSDILSRPVDVSKYALIYGGAQKNVGPAGLTFVIVNPEALGKVSRKIPSMVDYRTHIKSGSMFNTPPCLPIYSALMTMQWLKSIGGVPEIMKRNIEKSTLLYNEIDRNKLFVGTVVKEDRSRMNVCFVLKEEYKDLEADFLALTSAKGMVGLKGHRSVGGFRASLYNAMPLESVQALVDTMQEFEANH